jgi:hypothetical protein
LNRSSLRKRNRWETASKYPFLYISIHSIQTQQTTKEVNDLCPLFYTTHQLFTHHPTPFNFVLYLWMLIFWQKSWTSRMLIYRNRAIKTEQKRPPQQRPVVSSI